MKENNSTDNKLTNLIGFCSLIIALLVFLFGDNVIGERWPPATEPTVVTISTEATELYNAESLCTVPYVIGYEQTEAITIIENAKLDAIVEVSEENVSDDCYYVINQSIPAGTSVPIGTTVTMELAPK